MKSVFKNFEVVIVAVQKACMIAVLFGSSAKTHSHNYDR